MTHESAVGSKEKEKSKTAELRVLSEKDLKFIEELRPMDDALMRALFHEDVHLAQELIRSIPGYENVIITRSETQKDMPFVNGAHSLQLDIWGVGSDKTQYNFEIQRAKKGADPRRPRYHHAVLDIGTLDAGENYTQLPETVVIFLTEEDICGDGLLFHEFHWHDTAHSLDLDTGQTTLYIFARGLAESGQERLAKLAKDMLTDNPDEIETPALAEKMSFLKRTEKGRTQMSDIMLEYTRDAREEGREEGRKEERYSMVRKLYEGAGWSIEQIAEITKLTRDEVADAVRSATA